MRISAGYTGGWVPRGGALDVSSEGIAFEPHRGERLLWARGLWIPAREVATVEVQLPRLRLPGTAGTRRLRILTTDQRVHLIGVGFADEVADRVRAILSSQAIDDEEQARFENKLRRSSSTGLLTLVSALAVLWLLWNLATAVIAGHGFGTGELISAGFVVLMVLTVLMVYLWDRRRESGP